MEGAAGFLPAALKARTRIRVEEMGSGRGKIKRFRVHCRAFGFPRPACGRGAHGTAEWLDSAG
jgi:hypothetical protein